MFPRDYQYVACLSVELTNKITNLITNKLHRAEPFLKS
jgi:hypothetical protein